MGFSKTPMVPLEVVVELGKGATTVGADMLTWVVILGNGAVVASETIAPVAVALLTTSPVIKLMADVGAVEASA